MKRRRQVLTAGAIALAMSAGPGKAQQFINVLTGGTSGVYYPLGVALSEIYAEGIEGARTQVQATKASVENLNLLQQGKGEIAFSLGDSVQARRSRATPRRASPARSTSCAGSPRSIPTTSRSSPARSPASRRSRTSRARACRSARRPRGPSSTRGRSSPPPGMSYDDLGRVEYLPFAESVELIKNRQLDATLQSAGLGVASIRDLATSVPINVVAVPRRDRRGDRRAVSWRRRSRPAPTTARRRTCRPRRSATSSSPTRTCPTTTVYEMTKLLFDEPRHADRRPRRRRGDRPGQGARRHAGAAASGRRALLPRGGLLEVARRRAAADERAAAAGGPGRGPAAGLRRGRGRAGRLRHRRRLLGLPDLRPPPTAPAEPGGPRHARGLPAAARLRADRQPARARRRAGRAWFWLLGRPRLRHRALQLGLLRRADPAQRLSDHRRPRRRRRS